MWFRVGPIELSSAAPIRRGGWHAAAGCGRAIGQRLDTEFLISAAEFIDISTARVRIF
jgi:hypothetical protein